MPRLSLDEIEAKLLDIAAEQLGLNRRTLFIEQRLVEDLGCDSLDMVELIMEIEEAFDVTLPDRRMPSVYKTVFTRSPFRLANLAELVYLQQGSGAPNDRGWRTEPRLCPEASKVAFTQLGGRFRRDKMHDSRLLEKVTGEKESTVFRRRTDGMRCLLLPAATVEIGSPHADADRDARPQHSVYLDSFFIDAEPVSTTAYCRFLNSLDALSETHLRDWFILEPNDDRVVHQLISCDAGNWRPIVGAETWPMILVSWFGACAYSLWANDCDWQCYSDPGVITRLPSEAQWEYASRGAKFREFPWGDDLADDHRMRFARHRRSQQYSATSLPLADVHDRLGMSPFGLHHMAGNVWQWCADWYDETFYSRPESLARNPVNWTETGIRSERGGSWIGPATLCRSSYRRGRPPSARGRCLGFRCVTLLGDTITSGTD